MSTIRAVRGRQNPRLSGRGSAAPGFPAAFGDDLPHCITFPGPGVAVETTEQCSVPTACGRSFTSRDSRKQAAGGTPPFSARQSSQGNPKSKLHFPMASTTHTSPRSQREAQHLGSSAEPGEHTCSPETPRPALLPPTVPLTTETKQTHASRSAPPSPVPHLFFCIQL